MHESTGSNSPAFFSQYALNTFSNLVVVLQAMGKPSMHLRAGPCLLHLGCPMVKKLRAGVNNQGRCRPGLMVRYMLGCAEHAAACDVPLRNPRPDPSWALLDLEVDLCARRRAV